MIELLWTALLLLLSYGIGAYILRLFKLDLSRSEDFIFSAGLGFGAIAYMMFFIGISGFLCTRVAYGLILILLIATFANIKRILVNLPKTKFNFRLSHFGTIIGLILLAHIIVNLVADMGPPMNGDTLGVYLAIPKIWAQQHRITGIPHLNATYLPSTVQMLSTLGLLLRNGILSQMVSGFLMSILAVSVVYLLARRWFSREISLTAACIFYSTDVINCLAYSAKVDLGWVFFELLAIFAFLSFIFEKNKKEEKWLLLSAAFLGLSLATKYSAYSIPIIAVGAIIKFIFFDKKPIGSTGKALAKFFIIISAVASAWYIRNYILTGNPAYPLFTEAAPFGMKCAPNQASGVLGYFTVFWHMCLQPMSEKMSHPAGPVFLGFIPCLLFLKKIDKRIKLMLIYSFMFSIIWYTQLQRTRHFLPALALLSIAAAYAIYRLKDFSRLLNRFIGIILIIILLFSLIVTLKHNILTYNPIPFVLGRETKEEFLSRSLSKFTTHADYEIIKYINENTNKSARVLIIPYGHGYYIDRDVLDGWQIVGIKDVDEIRDFMHKQKISHILINPFKKKTIVPACLGAPNTRYLRQEGVVSDAFLLFKDVFSGWFGETAIFSNEFRKDLKLILSHNGQYLYEVKGADYL